MTRTVRRLGRRCRTVREGDDGQVLLLILVYALISVALVAVVVSASAVHLERKQLLAVADSAALDAADAVDEGAFYAGATQRGGGVPLTDASVRSSVEEYTNSVGAGADFEGLAIGSATGTPDGETAQVVLIAVARPPLIGSVLEAFSSGVPLQVTAQARTGLGVP